MLGCCISLYDIVCCHCSCYVAAVAQQISLYHIVPVFHDPSVILPSPLHSCGLGETTKLGVDHSRWMSLAHGQEALAADARIVPAVPGKESDIVP